MASLIRMERTAPGERRWYYLDDGTGEIRGTDTRQSRGFLSDEDPKECEYVRVIGKVSAPSNNPQATQRYLDVTVIRRVTSPFEPYHHLLNAMMATRWYNHGPPVCA